MASSRGRVFYFVGCDAWKRLSKNNLRFYRSAEEARSAGLSPSTTAGCGIPAHVREEQVDPPPQLGEDRLVESDAACIVDKVIDGDTLDCADGTRVRLLLIDSPETGQGVFGDLARTTLEAIAPAGMELTVYFDVERQDRYERTLAHLMRPDGVFVNEEMLRRGMAVVSVYPPNVTLVDRYRVTVADAQAAKVGLWALNGFECEPSAYRRGECR